MRSAMAAPVAPGVGAAASGAPLRMAYIYFPNGAHQSNWWPTGEGRSFTVPQLGQFKFGKHNVVITGDPLVFTKDNVDKFNF